jgi:hypothetical protein
LLIKSKKFLFILLLVILALALAFGLNRWARTREVPPIKEIRVEVEAIRATGEGRWLIGKAALERKPGSASVRAARLKNLRVEKIGAELIRENDGQVLIRTGDLKSGDLLIRQPSGLTDGQAVAPQGPDDETLIRLTIEAGLAGLRDRDLNQSLRFISSDYRDAWGFNQYFMKELLKRAYQEFDDLRLELASDPEVRINGRQALVLAKVRLTAQYQGRRNFLLGDREGFNTLVFQIQNTPSGWKVINLKGLRPLGFDERFFRLLGGDIGLPLNESERGEKKAACMPCRDRMAERFGPYRK